MNKSKILVQAVMPVVDRLNEKMKALGLRRDAYLNTVFKYESERLAEELNGKCNSALSREYLLSNLRALPTTPMSIMFDKEVIATIDASCSKVNVPRDCFINRVFFFLAAEAKHLELVHISIASIMRHVSEALSVNALDNAGLFLGDPFHELRIFMHENESSLYEWPFNGRVVGLNCYLEDSSVPGTKERMNLESMLSGI
jgi:hypothetical protein